MLPGDTDERGFFFRHVAVPAIGAECDIFRIAEILRIPDFIAFIRSRVLNQPARHFRGVLNLAAAQMHAMCEDRALRQRAEFLQTLERACIAARLRIFDIHQVFGDVHMDYRPKLTRKFSSGTDYPVGYREACVQSN